MKSLSFIAVILGLALIWHLLSTREGFVAEFIEHGNHKRTLETGKSSHRQETNHYPYIKQTHFPVSGVETPFRVNIWNSYQPV
jgi:hypothetical protein